MEMYDGESGKSEGVKGTLEKQNQTVAAETWYLLLCHRSSLL